MSCDLDFRTGEVCLEFSGFLEVPGWGLRLGSSLLVFTVLGRTLGSVAPLQGTFSVVPLFLSPPPAELFARPWIWSIRCCAKPGAGLGLELPEAVALGIFPDLPGLGPASILSAACKA